MNRTFISLLSLAGTLLPLVFDSALKGFAMLVLAGALALGMGHASAARRHLVWLVAMVALLIVPVLSVALPSWRVLPQWAAAAERTKVTQEPASTPEPPPIVPIAPTLQPAAAPTPPSTDIAATIPDVPSVLHHPTIPDAPSIVASIPQVASVPLILSSATTISLAWTTICVLLLLRLLTAHWLLRRASASAPRLTTGPLHDALTAAKNQLHITQRVTLLLDEKRTIPVVWGVIRPQLMLPAEAQQWDPDQLQSVLLHELAHIRRRDAAVQWLTQIVCALHWFNPLVWLAAWRLHVERERACDDLVLASGVKPSAYAEHLLQVATHLTPARWTAACGLAMARKSSLEGRLLAVLSGNSNRRGVTRLLALTAVVLTAAISIPLAMLRAADSDQPITDTPIANPEPKTQISQALLNHWKLSARADGKIPGDFIGQIAASLKTYMDLNTGTEVATKCEAIFKKCDANHDWTPADAAALLDEIEIVAPDHASRTMRINLDHQVHPGKPLPGGETKFTITPHSSNAGNLTVMQVDGTSISEPELKAFNAFVTTEGSLQTSGSQLKFAPSTDPVPKNPESPPLNLATFGPSFDEIKLTPNETNAPATSSTHSPSTKATPLRSKNPLVTMLIDSWKAYQRPDGSLPGGLLRELKHSIETFAQKNPADSTSKELSSLSATLDSERVWSANEIVSLLDQLSDISKEFSQQALLAETTANPFKQMRLIGSGKKLPVQYAKLAWGTPTENGLRAAWMIDPPAAEYALGTSITAHLLVYNSGENPVIFQVNTRSDPGFPKAMDIHENAIKTNTILGASMGFFRAVRLAPQEYCATQTLFMVVGGATYGDIPSPLTTPAVERPYYGVSFWSSAPKLWMHVKPSDDVNLSSTFKTDTEGWPQQEEPAQQLANWNQSVAQRVALESPLPTTVKERAGVLRRIMHDIFAEVPTQEEIDALANGTSTEALAQLTERLQQRPPVRPFVGELTTGKVRFRVTPRVIDPAQKIAIASSAGYYALADDVQLSLAPPTTKFSGAALREATLNFLSNNQDQSKPLQPYTIALPNSRPVFTWERNTTMLWLTEMGTTIYSDIAIPSVTVRSFDFADPLNIKVTEMPDHTNWESVLPPQFHEIVRTTLGISAAPSKGQSDAPIFERIFEGGTETLRGFKQSVTAAKTSTEAEHVQPANQTVIHVRKDGTLVMDQKDQTFQQLEALLAKIAEANRKQPIIIRSDKETAYEDVIKVLDACQKAGLHQVALAVQPDQSNQSTETPPSPKHEYAQSLYQQWQAHARTDGKIPGALIGHVAEQIDNFLKQYPTDAKAPALAALRPRLETSHDWTPEDVVKLMDDITAISTAPISWASTPMEFAEMHRFRPGQPLPESLAKAAWGPPADNGLRAAYVFDPSATEYPLGSVIKARVLFHNSGQTPVIFKTETWHQNDKHRGTVVPSVSPDPAAPLPNPSPADGRDAPATEIPIPSTWYTGLTPVATYRLAPGEYVEVPAHGIAIGAGKYEEEHSTGSVGAVIEATVGQTVHFSSSVAPTYEGWTRPNDPKDPTELYLKNIADRIALAAPLPKSTADRELLLKRAMPDLFGEAPTDAERTMFTTDVAPDALDKLTARLQAKPRLIPFSGNLLTGEIIFKVLPADPNAATAPRTATGPGRYVLGKDAHLQVTQTTAGDKRTNQATINFLSPDPKIASPHKPYEIELPEGTGTYALAWERSTGVLWVMQAPDVNKQWSKIIAHEDKTITKTYQDEHGQIIEETYDQARNLINRTVKNLSIKSSRLRKIEFADPTQLKTTEFEQGRTDLLPPIIREAFTKCVPK